MGLVQVIQLCICKILLHGHLFQLTKSPFYKYSDFSPFLRPADCMCEFCMRFLAFFESVLIYETCLCMVFEWIEIKIVSWSILQPEVFFINGKAQNR